MTKTFETFDMIRELVNNKTVRDQAWVQIKKQAGEYIDETVCLQNSCRYEQGKIAFEVASMFVGIGELKAGLQAAKFTKLLKAVDNISDQIKVIHRAIHGLGGKFVKSTTSTAKGVVNVVMKSGQKVFKCTNGLLSEIRWKTGGGWIESKVLYGVDYINSTGDKVKNGVLKLYKRTNCRLSADAADDACDWAVEEGVRAVRNILNGELEVGLFTALKKTNRYTLNQLTAHHIPSKAFMKRLKDRFGNLDDVDKIDSEGNQCFAITVESLGETPSVTKVSRHSRTKTYLTNPPASYYQRSPLEVLLEEIEDIRVIYQADGIYTPAVEKALKAIIDSNLNKYPNIFKQ